MTTPCPIHTMPYPDRAVRLLQRLGLTDHRNMLWSWYSPRNFGDWIGPYLYFRHTGTLPLFFKIKPGRPSRARAVASAGSILRHISKPDCVSVWGSGIMSQQDSFAAPLRTLAVRGPRTHRRMRELGYDCPEVFGDPAILLPKFYSPREGLPRRKIGIIPHYVDLPGMQQGFPDHPDVRLIDVTDPIEAVVDAICACDVTVSSSLHGVIVSHAYGIPSAWMRSRQPLQGDNVKFLDHYEAGGCAAPDPIPHPEPEFSVERLLDTARAFPFPDLDRLREPLWAACPFRRQQDGKSHP